jgi:hypothetical protein
MVKKVKYLAIEHNGNGEIESNGVSIIEIDSKNVREEFDNYENYNLIQALIPLIWVEELLQKEKQKEKKRGIKNENKGKKRSSI